MQHHRSLLAIPVIATLAACATTGSPNAARLTYNDCFFASTLTDWRPLDNEHLIMFVHGRRPYLVELVRPAMSLSYDFMIGVYDRDGRICPFGGDAIVTGGFMPERIPIRSIRRLSEEQLEAVYIEYGIRPPAIIEAAPADADDSTQTEG